MTGWVNLERSSPISRHLSICSEAKDSTYVRDVDLKSWAELPGKNGYNFLHFVPFGYNENEMMRSSSKNMEFILPKNAFYIFIYPQDESYTIKTDFVSRMKKECRNLKAQKQQAEETKYNFGPC